ADLEPLETPEVWAMKRGYVFPVPACTRSLAEHRAAADKLVDAQVMERYPDAFLERRIAKVDTEWSTWKRGERAVFEVPTAPYRIDGVFYGMKGEYYLFGDIQVLKEDIPKEILMRFDA